MPSKKDLEELRRISVESARRADELLADEMGLLKSMTATDIERLLPRISDQESFERLLAVVDAASRENLDLAAFKKRLEDLGSNVLKTGKKAADLIKSWR